MSDNEYGKDPRVDWMFYPQSTAPDKQPEDGPQDEIDYSQPCEKDKQQYQPQSSIESLPTRPTNSSLVAAQPKDAVLEKKQEQEEEKVPAPLEQEEKEAPATHAAHLQLEALINASRPEERHKLLQMLQKYPLMRETLFTMMGRKSEREDFAEMIKDVPGKAPKKRGMFRTECKDVPAFVIKGLAKLQDRDVRSVEELHLLRRYIFRYNILPTTRESVSEDQAVSNEESWQTLTTKLTRATECLQLLRQDRRVHNVLGEYYEKSLNKLLQHQNCHISRAREWRYAYAIIGELQFLQGEEST
jgi:hypothetical protein